ncbi:MAG: type II secretion system protein GspE, partial [Lachnospiraceae bacterium]|nr:type II secretion system protein GspE [Lachnospiraceae bacterium]
MAEMFRRRRLGDMLVAESVITEDQLMQALEAKKESGKRLGEVLVELGITTEEKICKALERQLGVEMVTLANAKVPAEIADKITGSLLRKHMVIPFGYDPSSMDVLMLAMADPMDMDAIDDISMITGLQVEAYIATSHDIIVAIDKNYGNEEAQEAADAYAKERGDLLMEELAEDDSVSDSPIVILVKTMIEQAARLRASDIHVEALETRVRIRYRIDGSLYEQISYD